jgi:hypothetical protein
MKKSDATQSKFQELIENPPRFCQSIATLASWAGNYEARQGNPFQVFLDLIGFNQHWYGMKMVNDPSLCIGYMEAGQIGEALVAYADHPTDVTLFIHELLDTDSGE